MDNRQEKSEIEYYQQKIKNFNEEINQRDAVIKLLTRILQMVCEEANIKSEQIDYLIEKIKINDYNFLASYSSDSLGDNAGIIESLKREILSKTKQTQNNSSDRIIQIESRNFDINQNNNEKNICRNKIDSKLKKKLQSYRNGFNSISFDDYDVNNSYNANSNNKINNYKGKGENVFENLNIDATKNRFQKIQEINNQIIIEKNLQIKPLINLKIPSHEYISYFILNYLNAEDLINLALINKNFYTISKSNKFWNKIYFQKYDIMINFDENDNYDIMENAKHKYLEQNEDSVTTTSSCELIINKKSNYSCKKDHHPPILFNEFPIKKFETFESFDHDTKIDKINCLLNRKSENIENQIEKKIMIDCQDVCKEKSLFNNCSLKMKFFEINKINKNWELRRPVVTTISTSECITGLNLVSKENELICTSSDGSATLYKLYSYRRLYSSDDQNQTNNFTPDTKGKWLDYELEHNSDSTITKENNKNKSNKFYRSDSEYLEEKNCNLNKKIFIQNNPKKKLLFMQHHKQTKICDKKQNFQGHSGPIWCLDRSGNILFTGSYDKTIKLWEVSSGICLNTFRAHTSWVSSINYSKHFNTLLSASWDTTIKLWKISDFEISNNLILQNEGGNYIYCVKENLSEGEIFAGTEFKKVDLWDVNKNEKKCSFQGHAERINNIKYSKEKNILFSAGEDKSIRLWDPRLHDCQIIFLGHKRGITQVEFDYLNNRVISASMDKTIKIWDIRKNEELRTLIGHSSSVYSLAFDQTKIISGSKDNSIRIWNFLN